MIGRRTVALAAAGAALVALGVAVLVARDGAPAGPVASAPERARDARSFSVFLSITMDGPAGSRTTESRGTRDVATGRSHLLLYPVLSEAPLELVAEGRAIYLAVPPERRSRANGKQWVTAHAETPAGARGAALGPIPDPFTFLESLRAAHDVERLSGRRYRGHIRVDDLTPEGSAMRRFGVPNIAVEVLLDRHGRPARSEYEIEVEEGKIRATLAVRNFGDPILIPVPRPALTHRVATVDTAWEIVAG